MSYRVSHGSQLPEEVQAVRTVNALALTSGTLSVWVTTVVDGVPVTRVCVFEGNGSVATLDGRGVTIPKQHCVTVAGSDLGPAVPLPTMPPMPPVPKASHMAAGVTMLPQSEAGLL